MIATCSKPRSSSAWRMAPTRPSIMSDGATMSAPAAACDTAARTSCSTVASLAISSSIDEAAVAVDGVLAQADVGDDQHVRHFALDGADRRLHRPLGIVGRRADRRPSARGRPNSSTARHAVGPRGARFAHRFVDREVVHARHRRHLAPHASALADEQRQHELVRRQARFADQRAQRRRAQAAQPVRQRRPIVSFDVVMR